VNMSAIALCRCCKLLWIIPSWMLSNS